MRRSSYFARYLQLPTNQRRRFAGQFFSPRTVFPLRQRDRFGARPVGFEDGSLRPGKFIDSDVVRIASREAWGDLLKAGITIAEYQPTMFHVKAMVVDSLLVSVGSTNFDNRSFSLNDEANLNVMDAGFAAAQGAIFEKDWAKAKPITLAQWENRSWAEKLAGEAAALFGTQL